MRTIICLLALTFAVCIHATETTYFIYGDVQTMGGYPMIGTGVRLQKGIHSFDLSGNFCPLNPPQSLNIFHLKSLYLVYPKQREFYYGGGLGILSEPESIRVSGSFESTIGYQWKNRIFLEGNVTVPFKQSQVVSPIWPGLTLGFGF